MAAVAEDVDHDVARETLAVGDGEASAVDHRLDVVAVHVEDRRLDHLRHVGAIERRSRLGRVGGEPDLVVDHDVERSAGRVAREVTQIERLGDDSLTREGGVSVEQQRQDGAAPLVARASLLGPRPALDDRVDRLQVGRVRGEREVNVGARPCRSIGRVSLVVLDVSRAEGAVEKRSVLELREQRLEGAPDDVREHAQPPAVRHPEDDLDDAVSRSVLDDHVEERNHRFGAFQGEALLPQELRVDEAFEELGRSDLLQDPEAVLGRDRAHVLGLFQVALEPELPPRLLDVGELDSNRAAIGGAQALEDLAERLDRPTREVSRDEGAVEVILAEAVMRRVELREVGGVGAQWVLLRDAMTSRPIRVDESQYAGVLLGEMRLELSLGCGRCRGESLDCGFLRLLPEQLGPARVDRGRVDLVSLADLLYQRRIYPELGEYVGIVLLPGLAAGLLRSSRCRL